MTWADYVVLTTYFIFMIASTAQLSSHRRSKDSGVDAFIDRRAKPSVVAFSLAATSLSGATFIGVPESAFRADLTYIMALVATVFASALAGQLFLQLFLRRGYTTVYEFVGDHCGVTAQRLSSIAFLAGRFLASAARLYIAAIPLAVVLMGSAAPADVSLMVVILGGAAIAYTARGGIRAVMYTDRVQLIILAVAVIMSIAVLLVKNEHPLSAIFDTVSSHPDKVVLVDMAFDFSRPFTLWSSLTGVLCFGVASLVVDQDLAQRVFSLSKPESVTPTLVVGAVCALVIGSLFVLFGFLLFVGLTPQDQQAVDGDTRRLVIDFVAIELPPLVRGLVIAGLCAAAMSSTDSALSSIAHTWSVDLVSEKRGGLWDISPRVVVVLAGVLLIAIALGFAAWSAGRDSGLIPFALGVMIYSYSGLLGLFIVIRVAGRGHIFAAIAGLLSGPTVIIVLQGSLAQPVSYGWLMLAGTLASSLAAALGLLFSRNEHAGLAQCPEKDR